MSLKTMSLPACPTFALQTFFVLAASFFPHETWIHLTAEETSTPSDIPVDELQHRNFKIEAIGRSISFSIEFGCYRCHGNDWNCARGTMYVNGGSVPSRSFVYDLDLEDEDILVVEDRG